ncbi:polyamine aminopropyltransferase [Cuneatibacter sp. NSJ-177]|uniref:polyamine aminopropyltransferase n=1 Tax=Cuneatibacter sp. NSJ-177 TaxID=2931401 RepID=UPI001FD0969F|nr:polyamine aminopropyltransferase [Cuneatibacter sp. NSJ-177]MCJ7833913.1 polyamine aminopropyltransferase [Cuneatibacter sp. NSJ-177]
MERWFTEYYTGNTRFEIAYTEKLMEEQSPFQKIEVFQTDDFGKILVIDGYLMITEKDEFIYHEMLVHVPMAVHPNAGQVLVIGGGDGGAVRELLRYPEIQTIDLVEIDERVVKACRKYFPEISGGLGDPRVSCHYQDGTVFIKEKKKTYDLILIDSTDPVGPGEGLFGKEFYQNCSDALKENGILVNQHESPYYPGDRRSMLRAHQRLQEVFPLAEVYHFHMPTYASGLWLFGFASKGLHPVKDADFEAWQERKISTGYYNPDIHRAAFALPNFLKQQLEGTGTKGWCLL